MRTQAPLSALRADEGGYVRFECLSCPRTGKVPLATLHERFSLNEGLVNILNMLAREVCAAAKKKEAGQRGCGFCYRDLGRKPNG
ncbi:hypothetical protein [Phenylobacterium sp.]|uniref:hypothetical protein n=1 Tax=Phenylobacterium sp. TaxID=1871053 RepID=UPI002E35AEDB|nr:hypothetical protein [Phenylobacterium sp.]HEX3365711.1 hypothetical protein [Phenylobacterium sp.]